MHTSKTTSAMVKPAYGAYELRAETFNADDRTVEVIWAAGERVKRYDWDIGPYIEELSMEPEAIRMERFETGAMSLLNNHDSYDMESRLGVVQAGSVRIEGGKAYATVKISRNARGEDLIRDLQDGMPFPVSVGYRIHAYEETDGNDEALPVRLITDWEPFEISACPVQADAKAHSRSADFGQAENECKITRNSAENSTVKVNKMNKYDLARSYNGDQLTAFAMAFGLERAADEADDVLSARLIEKFDVEKRAAEDAAAAAEQAATAEAEAAKAAEEATAEAARNAGFTGTPEEIQAMVSDVAARAVSDAAEANTRKENERREAINNLAERHGKNIEGLDEMRTAAIANGHTHEQFRDAMFEKIAEIANRAPASFARASGGSKMQTQRRDAAVSYLQQRANRTEMTDEIREFRGCSLIDLAQRALGWAGVDTNGLTKHEIAKRALSTGDFPIILSNLAGKTLAASYAAAPKTFEAFTRSMNISDFKPRYIIRKGLAPQLQLKNENGEYNYGNFAESKEQIFLKTYGIAVRMTREMLVNDDLDAFVGLTAEFGQSAATLESDIVYGLLLSNPQLMEDNTAVFAAGHNNLSTGAASALSATSLSAAKVKMSKQKDLDGDTTLNLSPNVLVIPPELEMTAEQLMTSITPNVSGEVVPKFIPSLVPVSEARLSNGISKQKQIGVNVSGSATAWYMMSKQVDSIVTAYMDGQSGVYTEEELDFDTDGVKIKARHDFGAAWGDYRGSHKSNGAA
jgi:hypothetical protein